MKKAILAILLMAAGTAAYSGSNIVEQGRNDKDSIKTAGNNASRDSINIKQIVLSQIEAARIKEAQDSLKAPEAKSISSIPVQAPVVAAAKVTLKQKPEESQLNKYMAFINPMLQALKLSKDMTMRVSVMGFVSIIAFLFVFIRRKRMNSEQTSNKSFKDGIKLIREEKVKDKKDAGLSQVREKLMGIASSSQLSGELVTKNARELNIAKGEIYLAARIKSHELKKASY